MARQILISFEDPWYVAVDLAIDVVSHRKYSDGEHVVIIPMYDEVAKGTLKSILKQADVGIDEFLELLG